MLMEFPRPWHELFSWLAGEQTSSRPHVSTGLGTMLLGVSGNCEEREVTSLPDEFPKDPDSEKDTWKREAKLTLNK